MRSSPGTRRSGGRCRGDAGVWLVALLLASACTASRDRPGELQINSEETAYCLPVAVIAGEVWAGTCGGAEGGTAVRVSDDAKFPMRCESGAVPVLEAIFAIDAMPAAMYFCRQGSAVGRFVQRIHNDAAPGVNIGVFTVVRRAVFVRLGEEMLPTILISTDGCRGLIAYEIDDLAALTGSAVPIEAIQAGAETIPLAVDESASPLDGCSSVGGVSSLGVASDEVSLGIGVFAPSPAMTFERPIDLYVAQGAIDRGSGQAVLHLAPELVRREIDPSGSTVAVYRCGATVVLVSVADERLLLFSDQGDAELRDTEFLDSGLRYWVAAAADSAEGPLAGVAGEDFGEGVIYVTRPGKSICPA